MYLESIGEIIACRELYLTHESGSHTAVTVSVGKPQPFQDSSDYYCPFQISGTGSEEIKYAVGVDSVQALQLVMLMIGATLKFLNQKLGGNLRWEGSSEGDFGFPTDS